MRVGVTLAIFLGINLLLLAAYLWSHGGQTEHVSIEARGGQFFSHIDGRPNAKADLPAPATGGIVVVLGPTETLPSLPKPRGIDSIKVTSLSNGDVLFEDDFSSGPNAQWVVQGVPLVRDGVVGSRGDLALVLTPRDWGDVVVDATFKNLQGGAIMVRAQGRDDGVTFGFRPFRDFDNNFALVESGQPKQGVIGPGVQLSRIESTKALVAMALQFYPFAFLLFALAFLVVLALHLGVTFGLPATLPTLPGWLALAIAGGLALFGFTTALYLNYSFGSHMPHVPDELSYLFQAKLLSSGYVTAPLPPVGNAFDYFYPPFIVVRDGRWVGSYPFGHPLALAIGVRVGAAWLIPPLIGALSVVLTFAVGRKVYSTRVGVLAALLFAASPFFLMTASNFMSHNTAAFYLLGALACIAYAGGRPVLFGVLGGIAFGLLFNTQPLTAVVLATPIGLLILSGLLPHDGRLRQQQFIGGFVAGGLVMLAAYFLYNFAVTGDAFTSVLSESSGKLVGFGGENTPNFGIQNQNVQLAFLVLVLNGWPLTVGLMFVVMPFLLATRHRWDWFFLAAAVSGMGVYVMFIGNGIMHGPRYWYAIAPVLMLLSARGADRAAEVLNDLASRARAIVFERNGVAPQWPGILIVYVFVAALAGTSSYNWLGGHNTGWHDLFVPSRATDLKGFNFIDNRLVTLVDDAHLHNALVVVSGCEGWQCYGSLFWRNSPTLDGDIVYARDVPDQREALFKAFPNRLVYFAQYGPPAFLAAFGSTTPLAPGDYKNAPKASDIVLPSPTPTATPDPAESAARDATRVADLARSADALNEYYARHGAYPIVDVLQSFCRYPGLDAGCAALEILDPLPSDPQGDKTYYYFSADGTSFFLTAIMENETPPSSCDALPAKPEVPAGHLYCLFGSPVPGATPPPIPTLVPAP